jgi:DNA-binding YbaB/EbfC family protein
MTESQNPFEALGAGGFDMNALLQQAQQMQEQLAAAQERLADAEAEGTVGSVTVKVSGVGELIAVDIKPGGFDANDTESLADLGDMVVAAYRDAKAKADAMATDALGPLAGGLPGLPGGSPPDQPGHIGF